MPPLDPFSLAGRRALVTGASRGIGEAIAAALAARGAAVCLTGRKADALAPVVDRLRAAGADARAEVCHQGDPAAIDALFARLDADGFAPDVAVVNAATNPVFGPLLDVDLDAWRKVLEVNLTGAMLTARASARRMRERGKGSVVFVASVAGIEPMAGLGAYGVSKAGLLGLMRALSAELAPAGVRVNAVAPGLIQTRFAQALFDDQAGYRALMARTPMGRHGVPDDVAGVVAFLACDAAAYVTGQALVVDGGGRV